MRGQPRCGKVRPGAHKDLVASLVMASGFFLVRCECDWFPGSHIASLETLSRMEGSHGPGERLEAGCLLTRALHRRIEPVRKWRRLALADQVRPRNSSIRR